MINRIKSLAKEVTDLYVKPLRRQIHKYPELSFVEYDTSNLIQNLLDEWEIENEPVNITGIVANIKGKNPEKKTVAYTKVLYWEQSLIVSA